MAIGEAFMLMYHLQSIGINVIQASIIYIYNMSAALNKNNPGNSPNNKTGALKYH